MTQPYYQDTSITLYQGDSDHILPLLAPVSVDLVLTDPPYNVSEEHAAIYHARTGKVAQRRDFGDWDRADWTPGTLLDQAFRLLRPGGSLLAFCSDRLLAAYRTHPGFAPRGTIVWDKINAPPTPRPSYVSATEWIVWLQKPGAPATWNAGGYVRNVLSYPLCAGAERTEHPTQKPLVLFADLMLRHSRPGDVVFDPFCGSGTTLRAAKTLGRIGIGVELNPRYCDLAIRRLAQEAMFLEEVAA